MHYQTRNDDSFTISNDDNSGSRSSSSDYDDPDTDLDCFSEDEQSHSQQYYIDELNRLEREGLPFSIQNDFKESTKRLLNTFEEQWMMYVPPRALYSSQSRVCDFNMCIDIVKLFAGI